MLIIVKPPTAAATAVRPSTSSRMDFHCARNRREAAGDEILTRDEAVQLSLSFHRRTATLSLADGVMGRAGQEIRPRAADITGDQCLRGVLSRRLRADRHEPHAIDRAADRCGSAT